MTEYLAQAVSAKLIGAQVIWAQANWAPAGTNWGLAAAAATAVAVAAGLVAYRRWRRRRKAVYGSYLNTFELAREGVVHYAQWSHPKDRLKTLRQESVDAIRQYVQPGDLVIDIGAHTGDTTVPYALAAGAEGCVLALEPNPYVFRILERNARLNPEKTRIIALPFAATEEDGRYTFHYSDGGYCNGGFLSQIENQRHGHHMPLEVEGRNLQNYLREHHAEQLSRLSLVKVDAEGYDRQVLASIQDLLRAHRPVIVCEVMKRLSQSEREALFDLLKELDYDCYYTPDHHTPEGERLKRTDLLKWRHFDILALPRSRRAEAA